jgi:hypothetical protein
LTTFPWGNAHTFRAVGTFEERQRLITTLETIAKSLHLGNIGQMDEGKNIENRQKKIEFRN